MEWVLGVEQGDPTGLVENEGKWKMREPARA